MSLLGLKEKAAKWFGNWEDDGLVKASENEDRRGFPYDHVAIDEYSEEGSEFNDVLEDITTRLARKEAEDKDELIIKAVEKVDEELAEEIKNGNFEEAQERILITFPAGKPDQTTVHLDGKRIITFYPREIVYHNDFPQESNIENKFEYEFYV